ncbi:MAG: carbohydrate kinase [Clostridia bacterium]|nr:carbohydrate kinase [Clostridia bacterium]
MAIMGLDLGTSGCKSVVCAPDGTYISGAYREYTAQRDAGVHELDANVMWDCIREVVSIGARECRARTGDEVEAIIVTSFGEAGVPVDREGRVLHGIVLYTDNRGEAETNALTARFGLEKLMRTLYMKPHMMYTLPKLMWYKNERPEVFAQMHHFYLIEDYAVWRLSGVSQISYSLASRTMAFDVVSKRWCTEVLEAAGIDERIFSKPVSAGTVAGPVLPSLCEELGLSPDTLIITGAQDQITAALGAGAFLPGTSVDGMGTVECITPAFDRPFDDMSLINRGYVCAPHAIDGLYATYAFCYCGGALVQWFRDTVGLDAKLRAAQENTSAYRLLDAEFAADPACKSPTGILVLPHFAGAATPYMDSATHGAVVGLSLETTRAQFYRAVMEGITYEMRLNLEMLKHGGVDVRVLNATGGGSRSDLWMQIKADITGLPVQTLENPEAGAVGCIMLGAVAKGYYRDLQEASAALVRVKRCFEPDAAMHARYEEHFSNYRRMYDAVKDIYALPKIY